MSKTHIITLDKVRMRLEGRDIDGDGNTDEVETVRQGQSGISNIIQPSELGESLKELNLDEVNLDTRMTGMDMRARLHYVEVSSILALDALVAFRICPTQCLAFTRQKKRLSVSQGGKGREEIVQIVGGKKEQDAKMNSGGIMGAIRDKFTGGQK